MHCSPFTSESGSQTTVGRHREKDREQVWPKEVDHKLTPKIDEAQLCIVSRVVLVGFASPSFFTRHLIEEGCETSTLSSTPCCIGKNEASTFKSTSRLPPQQSSSQAPIWNTSPRTGSCFRHPQAAGAGALAASGTRYLAQQRQHCLEQSTGTRTGRWGLRKAQPLRRTAVNRLFRRGALLIGPGRSLLSLSPRLRTRE